MSADSGTPPPQADAPPFRTMPAAPHVATSIWQLSYYDATSDAPVSGFVKLPGGTLDHQSGQLAGDFPDSGPWKQT